jgi:hypothetical protein
MLGIRGCNFQRIPRLERVQIRLSIVGAQLFIYRNYGQNHDCFHMAQRSALPNAEDREVYNREM